MTLLDTSVIAALMEPSPQASLLDWVNRCRTETLFLSTVTVAEISASLQTLPPDRRRGLLAERFGEFVAVGFAQRVLDFDVRAAAEYGELIARRRRAGRPLGPLRAQIVATARAYSLSLATCEPAELEGCGVALVDPLGADL